MPHREYKWNSSLVYVHHWYMYSQVTEICKPDVILFKREMRYRRFSHLNCELDFWNVFASPCHIIHQVIHACFIEDTNGIRHGYMYVYSKET